MKNEFSDRLLASQLPRIFGEAVTIGYEAAGPVKQRKNMKQVRHQAQSAKIYEMSARKVICYGF